MLRVFAFKWRKQIRDAIKCVSSARASRRKYSIHLALGPRAGLTGLDEHHTHPGRRKIKTDSEIANMGGVGESTSAVRAKLWIHFAAFNVPRWRLIANLLAGLHATRRFTRRHCIFLYSISVPCRPPPPSAVRRFCMTTTRQAPRTHSVRTSFVWYCVTSTVRWCGWE